MAKNANGLPDGLGEKLRADFAAANDATRQTLNTVLNVCAQSLGAQDTSVLAYDAGDTLKFMGSTNPKLLDPDLPAVPINGSIAGFVFLTAQTMSYDQAAKADKFYDVIDKENRLFHQGVSGDADR